MLNPKLEVFIVFIVFSGALIGFQYLWDHKLHDLYREIRAEVRLRAMGYDSRKVKALRDREAELDQLMLLSLHEETRDHYWALWSEQVDIRAELIRIEARYN